jgi:hypothetical protein
MVEQASQFPQNARPNIDRFEVSGKQTVFFQEDNSSIWGLVINKSLEKAKGKAGQFRFMTISTENNNINVPLAHGIWSIEGAKIVANRMINNNLACRDYSEYTLKDISTKKETKNGFCFKCDKDVFKFLIKNRVFIKTLNPKKKNEHEIFYPKLMGENMDTIDIKIYPVNSSLPGYVNLNFIIKNNIHSEVVI